VTAMLEVKLAAGGGNDQDVAPLSLDAFERGHQQQQQHVRDASLGGGSSSNSMMDTSGQPAASITSTTHMMDQSPSTSGLVSASSSHHVAPSSTSMVPSNRPVTAQGFNRVHTSLLTSFEHFRALLISHQQSELSLLNQLMQVSEREMP
jgi:hypothetical protein